MAAVGEEHIVLAKETSQHVPFADGAEVNAMMPTDTFCSSYVAQGNMTYDPVQVCRGPATRKSRQDQRAERHGRILSTCAVCVVAFSDVDSSRAKLARFICTVYSDVCAWRRKRRRITFKGSSGVEVAPVGMCVCDEG